MALAHVTTHTATLLSRVLAQYQPLPKLSALLGKIGDQAQAAEDALWAIVAQVDYTQASGVWLDWLGRFVGETRQGAPDNFYRLYLAARIVANRSNGLVEDLLAAINAILAGAATITLTEEQIASVHLDIALFGMDDTTLSRLVQILRATRAAGVRLILTYWYDDDPSGLFTFSSDDTLQASSAQGWGDDTDPLFGGSLIDSSLA